MAQWIEDPQGRLEVEKVTKELKLPVWKANYKGKFRDFWNELWDKIEDYVVKLKGDTEKKSEGLNNRLVSAVGKHDGDFPISNAIVGNVYYSELTKKYYKCKVGGPAPMPNGNFIDLSILENLNRLENLSTFKGEILSEKGMYTAHMVKISNLLIIAISSTGKGDLKYFEADHITIQNFKVNDSRSSITGNNGSAGQLIIENNRIRVVGTDPTKSLTHSFMGQIITQII